MSLKKKTIDLEYWEALKDYDSKEVANFMELNFEDALATFRAKDDLYGGSWQKSGLNGAYCNVERKIDRFTNIYKSGKILKQLQASDGGEAIWDTIGDLVNYLIMFKFLLMKKNQERLLKVFPQDANVIRFAEENTTEEDFT